MGTLTIRSSAIISQCGRYRYRLERDLHPSWGNSKRTMTWIMVNPSTADAHDDDATIRKVCGFSERHGCDRVIVGNLFAWRSPDVRTLALADDPFGPENEQHLADMIDEADLLMVAWGPVAKVPAQYRRRWGIIPWLAGRTGKTMRCLGTAKDGHPRHPLMVAYATPLEEWKAPK